MNHLGKISIRMKLDDFTNEKVEKEILQELENIQMLIRVSLRDLVFL